MRIWQRNHAGGNINGRVIEVTDAVYHAEAVDLEETTATLEDRVRHSLVLAEARADEMARELFHHDCREQHCDGWHLAAEGAAHGERYPLQRPDAAGGGQPENLVIVQRGRTAWADFLLRRLGSVSEHLEVCWDRRYGDRRRQAQPIELERRNGDRRKVAPPAWNNLNFILVPTLEPRP
jgi:hypothetical protein